MSEIRAYIVKGKSGRSDFDTDRFIHMHATEPPVLNLGGRSWGIEGGGYWERWIDNAPNPESKLSRELIASLPDPELNSDPIEIYIDLEKQTWHFPTGLETTPKDPEEPELGEALKPGHLWFVTDEDGNSYTTDCEYSPIRSGDEWTLPANYPGDWKCTDSEEYEDVAFPIRDWEDEPIQIQIIGNSVIWQR